MAQMTVTPVGTQGFLVDGKWIESGNPLEIRAPYDGAPIAQVFQAKREHAEAVIKAAVKAFGTARRLPAFERQRVLRRVGQRISERKQEFVRTLAQEAGKPIKAARTEVERAIFTFTVAAEESTRIYGEYLPLDWQEYTAGRGGHLGGLPPGPSARIPPVNFSFKLVGHKIGPAVAAGLSVRLETAPPPPPSSVVLSE